MIFFLRRHRGLSERHIAYTGSGLTLETRTVSQEQRRLHKPHALEPKGSRPHRSVIHSQAPLAPISPVWRRRALEAERRAQAEKGSGGVCERELLAAKSGQLCLKQADEEAIRRHRNIAREKSSVELHYRRPS